MADEKRSHGDIINNFYNTVNKVVNNYGTINEYGPENYGGKEKDSTNEDKPVPTFDEMMQVFKVTHKKGYWSSSRSWGVGFQLWQIWGFKGTKMEFVKMVANNDDAKLFDHACNQDAVYKMMSKGLYAEGTTISSVLFIFMVIIGYFMVKILTKDEVVE